jgi:aconitate hydratase
VHEAIDLAAVEPLIATPSSPGNVVPVAEVAGTEIEQVVIGSSANPGLRDFAIAAAIVKGRQTDPAVSFDVNPTSRQILQDLTRLGATFDMVAAGARLHQSGCLGCIGMGQSPTTNGNSLRTMPRNFPGRSGTPDDHVYLCSPETAAASALTGVITDPRTLGDRFDLEYPTLDLPAESSVNTTMLEPPLPSKDAARVELVKGSNIGDLPDLDPFPDQVAAPVLVIVGDDISTDTIMPAGAEALPYRSNIPKLAEFAFRDVDPDYPATGLHSRDTGHVILGGSNYGQGSSREHAALAPRYLGLRMVLARSYARIHWQNLVNFGILPLELVNDDHGAVEVGDVLTLSGIHRALRAGREHPMTVRNTTRSTEYTVRHRLSPRQIDVLLAGGLIPWLRDH